MMPSPAAVKISTEGRRYLLATRLSSDRSWPIATFCEVLESTQYRGSVADIMITPAISVLSAVEGLQLAFDGITF